MKFYVGINADETAKKLWSEKSNNSGNSDKKRRKSKSAKVKKPLKIVAETGLELPPQTSGKTALSQIGGTESGTLAAQLAQDDAGLQVVIDVWPSLSVSTKRAILALINPSSE